MWQRQASLHHRKERHRLCGPGHLRLRCWYSPNSIHRGITHWLSSLRCGMSFYWTQVNFECWSAARQTLLRDSNLGLVYRIQLSHMLTWASLARLRVERGNLLDQDPHWTLGKIIPLFGIENNILMICPFLRLHEPVITVSFSLTNNGTVAGTEVR